MTKSRRSALVLAAVAASALALTGCSAGNSTNSTKGQTITVWSAQNQSNRIAIQQRIIDGFTKKTGIKVKLVGIDDSQFGQLVQSNALSGKLPDVMGALSLADVRELQDQKLLDTDAAASVVSDLGSKTFAASALKLSQDKGKQLSVPDSAWIQMLLYRKDIFAKEGLATPDTYANVEKAAQKLTSDGNFGITVATDPSDVFTQQTFESFALGNDCQLVNASGSVTIDSSRCQAAWSLYGNLAHKYSPSGTQTVDTTRATYFAGQAAMVGWSSYILSSLAGLDTANLPNCSECKGDTGWLAKNTGIVTGISGPDGKPAAYGEVSAWSFIKQKNSAAAEKFVEYMMSNGYMKWLSMAPEGMVPVRTGTSSSPHEYSDGWKSLETGVTSKAKLSSLFDASTLNAIEKAPETVNPWAISEGQGDLLGSISTSLVLPKIIAGLGNGTVDAKTAAQQAQQQVTEAQGKLK